MGVGRCAFTLTEKHSNGNLCIHTSLNIPSRSTYADEVSLLRSEVNSISVPFEETFVAVTLPLNCTVSAVRNIGTMQSRGFEMTQYRPITSLFRRSEALKRAGTSTLQARSCEVSMHTFQYSIVLDYSRHRDKYFRAAGRMF